MYKYFEKIKSSNLRYIDPWKSKVLSNEKINVDNTFSNLAPKLEYDNVRIKLKFDVSFLRHDKVTLNYGPIVNIYIVHKLTSNVDVNLAQLKEQEILLLINTNILDIVLDLIQEEVLHIQVESMAEMLLFLELVCTC